MTRFNQLASYTLIFLVLLNIPSIALEVISANIGSKMSYFTFMLAGYLIITNKLSFSGMLYYLVLIVSIYFIIGAFQYYGEFSEFVIIYIKFLLYSFGLSVAFNNINHNSIILFLLLGAFTIVLDSLFFRFNDTQGIGYVSEYGRYSGFYLNPNTAAFVCLLGYSLAINKLNKFKYSAILFTFIGFLTLSRTFMISWIIITIIFIIFNKKRINSLFITGITGIVILFSLSDVLKLDIERFEFLRGLFLGKFDSQFFSDGSRQNQWSKFYNLIYDSPFIGNGFKSFYSSSVDINAQGVHNTFLLFFGESGFLPFVLLILLFILLFKKSFALIKYDFTLLALTIVLSIKFLVSHNFVDSGLTIFCFVYIIYSIYIIQKHNLKL